MIDFILKPFVKAAILIVATPKIIEYEVEKEKEAQKSAKPKCDLCEEDVDHSLGSGLLCTRHYHIVFNGKFNS